jgi:hypothetical protein
MAQLVHNVHRDWGIGAYLFMRYALSDRGTLSLLLIRVIDAWAGHGQNDG